jgi:uncharacterized phage protein (TIGR02218 family)
MTDYTDNLEATQQAAMPEFYVFTSGSTVERYTTYATDLTFLGQNFAAASIQRGGIVHDTNFGEIKLNITTPITPNMAKYIPNQPIEPVLITIYRSHIDYLAQYEVFFNGVIKHVQFAKKLASAQCVSSNKFLTTKIPTVIYQAFCNHDIYDDGCGVDSFVYRRVCTVTDINNNGADIDIALVSGSSFLAGDFIAGKVNYLTDARLITGHASQLNLELHVPFDSRLTVGAEVHVYPGCDGDPDTCLNVYNNLDNFLGMPYIPSRNPVVWGFK